MRTSTCTCRTSSARELGRGACDLASTGSSVHRYYDPVTAQFVSVDPALGVTGQPYAYAGGDPVNGVDPSGLCAWGLGWACNVGNFISDSSRWRSEANYLAGVANGLTFDQLHVAEPYCNSLNWAYGVGSGFGFAVASVALATSAVGEGAAQTGTTAISSMDRVGSGLKEDIFHRVVSWVVDDPAASSDILISRDGTSVMRYTLQGQLDGQIDTFEWIVYSNGDAPVVTHQLFLPER